VLPEPPGGGGEGLGKDQFVETGPGEPVDGLYPVLDRRDLRGQPVQLLAATLAGTDGGAGDHQRVQALGVDQWQARQHPGIDAVALGVPFVEPPQVGHLLAVDQVDGHALLLGQVDRHGEPGHAGRLHHDLQLVIGGPFPGPCQELVDLAGPGVALDDGRHVPPALVGDDGFVGPGEGQIHTDATHSNLLVYNTIRARGT